MRLFKRKGPWEVRKTIWPYPYGYGTYNSTTHTLLDSGLTRAMAQSVCDKLNKTAPVMGR